MHKHLKIVSVVLLGFSFLSGQIHGAEWKSVPLRSLSQKDACLMGGEGMQMVQSISYAPSNPDIVYLVSDTSQVWKSIDGGKTWKMKHNGFHSSGGLSVAVDPLNENIVFVAGCIGTPLSRYNPKMEPLSGIFRTINGGDNWEIVKKTSYIRKDWGENGGKHFAFVSNKSDKTRTSIIYAGTFEDGLLKSMDGGNSWSYCGLKNINIYDLKTFPANQSIVFLATSKGLYQYNDNNHDTQKIGTGLPDYPRTVAINPKNPEVIYAAVGKSGVYWSTDGGMKFSKRDKGLPAGKEYTHISVSPTTPEYLYVSVNHTNKLNPFWSHDGGATWHAPNTIDQGGLSLVGEHRFFSGQIEPHPDNPNIAITAANGKARVIKTIDGGINWFYSGTGYTGGRMGVGKSSLAFFNDTQKMIFFLIDHGPALTIDGGETFKMLDVPRVNATTTPVGAVSSISDTNIIVTAIGDWGKQTLATSLNGGKNWKITPGTEDNYRFISFHPQKPNVIYAQGFISKDTGNSWGKLSQKICGVFKGNGDIVYSIDTGGKGTTIIKRSNDRGETWKTFSSKLPTDVNNINEIDIDPSNQDRIYVATNDGFYIYDGKKWTKKGDESGLSKDYFGMISFKCVVVDPKHPEVIYTGRWAPGKGHSGGVFRSVDYGKTWENITSNLGEPITIWSVSVSPHDGTVYIGSSHGTWKLPPPYETK
ncbi:MAG: hypothetical protein E3K38_04690 [Candidatus Kuenenia stuttgartiensis]|nr:hypothetical protein [Candidatus Kuenenia stuttgartiensis]